MQYENNLEKLKAEKPEGATHTDNLGEYWKHENGKWFTWLDSCQQWKRIINFEPFIKQFNVKPL